MLVGEQESSLQVCHIVEQTLAQIAGLNGSIRSNDDEDGSLWVGVLIVGVVPHRKRIDVTWVEVINLGLEPSFADHSVGDGQQNGQQDNRPRNHGEQHFRVAITETKCDLELDDMLI